MVWCGVGFGWIGVVWCGMGGCCFSHGVESSGMIWCGVPKALLPEGNGRDVYPLVQVNGSAVCLSARVQPGPVLNRTWPLLFCRRLCTVT